MLVLRHVRTILDGDGAAFGVERAFSDAIVASVPLRGDDAGDGSLDSDGAANTQRADVVAPSAADARGILAARGLDGGRAVDEDIAAGAITTDGVSAADARSILAARGCDVGRAAYLDAVRAGPVFATADACSMRAARGHDGAAGDGDFAA